MKFIEHGPWLQKVYTATSTNNRKRTHNHEDFHIVDNTIWVWTDGSLKNNVATSAIWTKENSTFNKSVAVPGVQENVHAELYAIKEAIENVPADMKVKLFF
jgi:hypothetical protein